MDTQESGDPRESEEVKHLFVVDEMRVKLAIGDPLTDEDREKLKALLRELEGHLLAVFLNDTLEGATQ